MLDKMKQLLSFDSIAKQQKQEQELQELIESEKENEVTLVSGAENNFIGITMDDVDTLTNPEPDPIFSTEVVGYPNRQVQYHFYSIIQNFIPADHSILHFGAGRGDFKTWHKMTYGKDLDYVGIEKEKSLVEAGKEANGSDINLQCKDWNKISKSLIKDWCVNIGSFNKAYEDVDDYGQYVKDTIDLMMNHSNRGVVISFTSDQFELSETDIENGLHQFNAGDLLKWASKKYKLTAVDHVGAMQYGQFILIIYKEVDNNG
jgi:hypothetical protein